MFILTTRAICLMELISVDSSTINENVFVFISLIILSKSVKPITLLIIAVDFVGLHVIFEESS